METKFLDKKIKGGLIFILQENTFLTEKNYSIIEYLEKGNNLLSVNSELSRNVFDTLRKAKNNWKKI